MLHEIFLNQINQECGVNLLGNPDLDFYSDVDVRWMKICPRLPLLFYFWHQLIKVIKACCDSHIVSEDSWRLIQSIAMCHSAEGTCVWHNSRWKSLHLQPLLERTEEQQGRGTAWILQRHKKCISNWIHLSWNECMQITLGRANTVQIAN